MKQRKRVNKTAFQSTTNCPVWLKNRILKNLEKTSKDRICQERAKKAKAILSAVNSRAHIVREKTQTDIPRPTSPVTDTILPVKNPSTKLVSSLKNSAVAIFHKRINRRDAV